MQSLVTEWRFVLFVPSFHYQTFHLHCKSIVRTAYTGAGHFSLNPMKSSKLLFQYCLWMLEENSALRTAQHLTLSLVWSGWDSRDVHCNLALLALPWPCNCWFFFFVFFFTVSRLLGTMELSKHKMMITVTTVTCIEKTVQAKNRTNTDIDPNA